MKLWRVFRSAVMAGIAIACGGICYLKLGGLAGAVLFTFGLITVVHYAYNLYTGTAGFVKDKEGFAQLWLILLGNIVGCFLTALAANFLCANVWSILALYISIVIGNFIGCNLYRFAESNSSKEPRH